MPACRAARATRANLTATTEPSQHRRAPHKAHGHKAIGSAFRGHAAAVDLLQDQIAPQNRQIPDQNHPIPDTVKTGFLVCHLRHSESYGNPTLRPFVRNLLTLLDDIACLCGVRAQLCVRAPNQTVTTDPPFIATTRSIALSQRIRGRVPVTE